MLLALALTGCQSSSTVSQTNKATQQNSLCLWSGMLPLTHQLNQYESRSQEPIKLAAAVMGNTRTEPAVKWMEYKQRIITLSNQTHALSQRPLPLCPPFWVCVRASASSSGNAYTTCCYVCDLYDVILWQQTGFLRRVTTKQLRLCRDAYATSLWRQSAKKRAKKNRYLWHYEGSTPLQVLIYSDRSYTTDIKWCRI